MYDYALGGKENFPADRIAAERAMAMVPDARAAFFANRSFLRRSVAYLLDRGVRQFLDIGTGLPTQGNVHELVPPDAQVVYVDYDPVVVSHASMLLAGVGNAVTLAGDLRRPDEILAAAPLDFRRPVGVLLVAVLHFLPDGERPFAHVARLREAMAPGSHLVLSHGTTGDRAARMNQVAKVYDSATAPLVLRGAAELMPFFAGLELLDPGLVPVTDWRPDAAERPVSIILAGVGRKD
ncbi:SAM-dependent methyltransferase [Actinomadura darangshiensis]|uniref:SAM-dependent methyltransferase n=2 Tax=Actinomadura darangshiensis TaxID=705336 RepID=A0A4R5BRL8_9ACTN|nr:SAM-dependent methyltransferase [Actinomadura darangshiensis]